MARAANTDHNKRLTQEEIKTAPISPEAKKVLELARSLASTAPQGLWDTPRGNRLHRPSTFEVQTKITTTANAAAKADRDGDRVLDPGEKAEALSLGANPRLLDLFLDFHRSSK
jgi:hypothetical protein